MPEIPEVEASRYHIAHSALHKTVDHVEVRDDRVLDVSGQKLWSNISGHRFESAERHGKYILVKLDNDKWLTLHFGMTGDVEYLGTSGKPSDEPEHSRVVFHFENGAELAFDNQRMFGEVGIVDDKQAFIDEKSLGPDVLELDYDAFKACLSGRRGMVKSALMDQSVMAGIGNVYSDEILFQAGIHPKSQLDALEDSHLKRIYDAMQAAIDTAIEARKNGVSLPDDYLTHRREDGVDCPKCDGQVKQISVSGRNAYCCPACQEEIS